MLTRRQFLRACMGAAAVVAPLAAGCAATAGHGDDERHAAMPQRSFSCFDTVCVVGGDLTDEQLGAAEERCRGFEQALSRTLATSDVGRVNAAGGAAVTVGAETARLVSMALGYCAASGGLFDITIGAVTELWDFHQGIVPSTEAIEAALPHVGWQCVEVDEVACTVRLADPDARLDLGGIAKGYVADALVCELAASGAQSAFVNLGGNVAVLGPKPDGTPWGIGVRDPADGAGGRSLAKVSATGGSVVTSGLYERRFERDGRSYWHILDPRTGYPVETDVVSVSVFSERSIDGDGNTKTPFMLGADEGLAYLEGQGVDGLLVLADGTVRTTVGSAFELL